MSNLTETSLMDMKAAFLPAPEPIPGIPTLQSLIKLLFHLCRCAQTHRSPASTKMNLLFCAAKPDLYAFFCLEAYLTSFSPFSPKVPPVPDYTACMNKKECATLKATHALGK
jgi:hypothetical protein